MSGWSKLQWGPIVGALVGAGLMAALVSAEQKSPPGARTDQAPALHGVVNAAWGALGRLLDESVHKLTFK